MGVRRTFFHFPIISFYWFYYISIRDTIADIWYQHFSLLFFLVLLQRVRLLYLPLVYKSYLWKLVILLICHFLSDVVISAYEKLCEYKNVIPLIIMEAKVSHGLKNILSLL